MKTQHLTSLIAFGAILPLTALGQSSPGNPIQREAYDPRPSETRSGPPSARTPEAREAREQSQQHRDMSADTQVYGQHQQQHGAAGQIQRVSSDQLDQRLTASSIIGKKIVDRDGQDVGKVKDISLGGLGSQLGPQASAQISTPRSDIGQLDERDQSEPRVGQPGARTGTSAQGQSAQWGASAGAEGETRIFVQPDRALGVRGDLVSIPASQLRREGDNFRVDMSRDQIRSLVAQAGDRATQTR